MKFSDVPGTLTTWISTFLTVVAGAGVIWAWTSLLHTDAEAAIHVAVFESSQEAQYDSRKNDRIDRQQREIDRIDYQLLDTELISTKREYLRRKRAELVAKIACIRADTC